MYCKTNSQYAKKRFTRKGRHFILTPLFSSSSSPYLILPAILPAIFTVIVTFYIFYAYFYCAFFPISVYQNTQVVPLLISPVVRGNGDGADNSSKWNDNHRASVCAYLCVRVRVLEMRIGGGRREKECMWVCVEYEDQYDVA